MNPAVAVMIKASGRSWWQCRYSDGKTLAEWDTLTDKVRLPIGTSRSSKWEEVPKKGMVGLRLLCPNGMAGELEAPEGCRFFQLKVGGVNVMTTFGGRVVGVGQHFQEAHIIGVVADSDGSCLCRAWETVVEVDERGKTTQTILPGTNFLIDGSKNWVRSCHLGKTVHTQGQLKYQERAVWGCLGSRLTILGKWETYIPNSQEYLITSLHKRLIEFRDNIYNMRYRNIGKLNLEVQQVRV